MPIIEQQKKMVKWEQKFHSQLMRYLKYNLHKLPKSFLIETKVVRPGSKNFSFKELSEKEERLLLRAKYGSVLQTHSDALRTGTNCDASCVSGGGYVFIQWVRPGNKTFYCIDINDLLQARNNNKTLNEKTASEIAAFVGELK